MTEIVNATENKEAKDNMNLLKEIQQKLKAPKGQKNSFGNYNYRSCEDILEAVKPLLGDAILTLNDEIVVIGTRYYVKATATFSYGEGKLFVSTSAFAREPEIKKGMDESQITGAASSYARKYALNGLFCIDDTKDADTEPPKKEEKTIQSQTDFLENAYLLYCSKHKDLKIDRKAFKEAVLKQFKKLPTKNEGVLRICEELKANFAKDEEAGMMPIDDVSSPPPSWCPHCKKDVALEKIKINKAGDAECDDCGFVLIQKPEK